MKKYSGKNLDLIGFPLGGIGAGMICLEGTGSFDSVSIRNRPNLFNKPNIFAAVTVLGDENSSRVIEAPVPLVKYFANVRRAGMGLAERNFGLPRFQKGEFTQKFPFAEINLEDDSFPLEAKITGWSPFIPTDADNSSLPVASLEYTLENKEDKELSSVFYFSSTNFMSLNDHIKTISKNNGFLFYQPGEDENPHFESSFMASTDEPCHVNTAWFRGGWFDVFTMQWKDICEGKIKESSYGGQEGGVSPGGSFAVPFTLKPKESKTIKVILSWYSPLSDVNAEMPGSEHSNSFYKPWYSGRFESVDAVAEYFTENYNDLKDKSLKFSNALFSSTLPNEIMEALSANLTILKSTTVLRQQDGRLWCWEASEDECGSCAGSCTHVWNYAQAFPTLFPALERTLRETEFFEGQIETGRQQFRIPLPIRQVSRDSIWHHPASDGQLGGIIKAYRDFKICGDIEWLKKMWPQIKKSMDFCIEEWDPDHEGCVKQPHHNTYDIEFWGPDAMITGFYLGALKAFSEMAELLNEEGSKYFTLYEKGRKYFETELYNGEYFIQKAMWENLKVPFDISRENDETKVLLTKEGPKYQYKNGCISDMVLGIWLAELSGVSDIIDSDKLDKALDCIYKYNFKKDLSKHSNTQRPGYAAGQEGGLLLCTWPHNDKPSLPFVYSDEVWTGIEYQVASHLISKGQLEKGLEIVRTCRARYDGSVRNPFNEYECGNWYARALSSYSLLWAYTGVRYDAHTKTLYYSHKNRNEYSVFLSTESGYGLVHVKGEQVNIEPVYGNIEVKAFKKV